MCNLEVFLRKSPESSWSLPGLQPEGACLAEPDLELQPEFEVVLAASMLTIAVPEPCLFGLGRRKYWWI